FVTLSAKALLIVENESNEAIVMAIVIPINFLYFGFIIRLVLILDKVLYTLSNTIITRLINVIDFGDTTQNQTQ
ncbi:MAG TPA: hypothetical protein VI278_09470, partial [Nitrososphaeraceae archaeon]